MMMEAYKRAAAERAAQEIRPGMTIGLGTGSTAGYVLEALAAKLKSGALDHIQGIPTSEKVGKRAQELGVPLAAFATRPAIDLTIDGADEVDPELNLIKGGGGALLREKIVAQASERVIIVVDESKLSDRLGTKFALPVEVIPFGWETQSELLGSWGAEVVRRAGEGGQPYRTDESNFILDCTFGPIEDVHALARKLDQRAGIVDHGLFLDLADQVVVGSADGVRVLNARKD